MSEKLDFTDINDKRKLIAHLENIYETVTVLADRVLVQNELIEQNKAEIEKLRETIHIMRYWE